MNKKRILVWTGGSEAGICRAIGALKGIIVDRAESKPDAIVKMAAADGFITSSALWDEDYSDALAKASRISWLQLINAGFDNVEKAGVPGHVTVSTIGGVGSNVVAEHAITMLLALLRRLSIIIKSQDNRRWAFESVYTQLTTLHNRDVTVIGYGHIGHAIADLLVCFETCVTVLTRSSDHQERKGIVIRPLDDLLSVLGSTDILILSIPLTNDTEFMIDEAAFTAMKQGAYLVNVSRGRIINTDALVKALHDGKLAGAALDVTDPEPLPSDHPLWDLPNVIISPHVAWAGGGDNVNKYMEELVFENVRRYLSGETVKNIVSLKPA